uniref:DNA_mis_repair domain-containing protein n=1 Tax=Syphacia muris TaxID=451379 RepID=A0A158R5Y2_9BILA
MGIIRKLSEDVVNRIAAGEVVVRACNAVKELIENSLDAGATEIIITAKNGGLDLLKVQDNGKGISKDDLPLVCERYATSKLTEFEDLQSMSTFGFRGEALASLSYVSKVRIVSKTADAPCAFIASYSDNRMNGNIRSSAGLDGTIVTAEELFYNSTLRRRALKNPAEEMSRIADVIIRYAINNPCVSFTFRRCGSGSDFRTPGDGDVANLVCSLIGPKAAEDLININFADPMLHFTLSGYMSRPVASCTSQTLLSRQERQKTFYLFVNGRSVEWPKLKHALDTVLASQNTLSLFVMLALQIAPNRVDVNVHPTKSTVLILEQEAIITAIEDYIERILEDSVQTCNVKMHTSLTSTNNLVIPSRSDSPDSLIILKSKKDAATIEDCGNTQSNSKQSYTPKKVYAHQLVRTDPKERRLDEFVVSQPLSQYDGLSGQGNEEKKQQNATTNYCREFNFTSLESMRAEICKSTSLQLRTFFKDHIYVGAIDPTKVLVQHGTSLYLLNVRQCFQQFFYQILVLSFGNFGTFILSESAPIAELFVLDNPNEPEENIKKCVNLLVSNRDMLDDYFSFRISSDGSILAIPSLVDGFCPQLESLPALVSALVFDVDWDQEKTCFEGICWAMADFFTPKPEHCKGVSFSALSDPEITWKAMYSDILFPNMKTNFLPSETLTAQIRRLADLPELYKVFERC